MIDLKRLFAQVEYEIGWNRPDIKSTALTWWILRSGSTLSIVCSTICIH